MSAAERFEGSCLCGAVRYVLDGPLSGVVCCHCTQCRKQTGHHFAAVVIPRDKFRLTAEGGLTWYRSSEEARRGFCGTCGSVLFWERIGAPTIDVLAGGIDGPLGVRVEAHVYVDSKGDYYRLCDDARRYPRGR